MREDDASGFGPCSHSVNSYGIFEMLLSGRELRPGVEIGLTAKTDSTPDLRANRPCDFKFPVSRLTGT
jgi:hypothetical protein